MTILLESINSSINVINYDYYGSGLINAVDHNYCGLLMYVFCEVGNVNIDDQRWIKDQWENSLQYPPTTRPEAIP